MASGYIAFELPKSCVECPFCRMRSSSLGDILDCKRVGTVGAKFSDPYDVLNKRHPDCPFNEKGEDEQ